MKKKKTIRTQNAIIIIIIREGTEDRRNAPRTLEEDKEREIE